MRFPRIFPRKVKFLSDTHVECEGRFDRFDIEITVIHRPNYRHKYTAEVKCRGHEDYESYHYHERHGRIAEEAMVNLIRYIVEYKEIAYSCKIVSKKTTTISVEGSELTDDRYR